jgi:hypothetical protein
MTWLVPVVGSETCSAAWFLMYGVTREPVTMALRTSKRRLHNLALSSFDSRAVLTRKHQASASSDALSSSMLNIGSAASIST